jgi:hypothetical protein
MDKVNIAKPDCALIVSCIPELIGKYPGVIVPATICKPNPIQFVKPSSPKSSSMLAWFGFRAAMMRNRNHEL